MLREDSPWWGWPVQPFLNPCNPAWGRLRGTTIAKGSRAAGRGPLSPAGSPPSRRTCPGSAGPRRTAATPHIGKARAKWAVCWPEPGATSSTRTPRWAESTYCRNTCRMGSLFRSAASATSIFPIPRGERLREFGTARASPGGSQARKPFGSGSPEPRGPSGVVVRHREGPGPAGTARCNWPFPSTDYNPQEGHAPRPKGTAVPGGKLGSLVYRRHWLSTRCPWLSWHFFIVLVTSKLSHSCRTEWFFPLSGFFFFFLIKSFRGFRGLRGKNVYIVTCAARESNPGRKNRESCMIPCSSAAGSFGVRET